MKEITRISLAQLPFNIEVAAKKSLEKYLTAIETSLDADSDMTREVEARIVELLADRGVVGEKVISLADISHIKQQMGEPKEFVSEPSDEVPAAQRKRLMRSEGDEVLGGVCGGMAAYFGIDVVWVRLAFVLLTFVTSGFMILVYIILWIVTPPAKTAADRLQMKGEAVTLSALQAESDVLVNKRRNDQVALMAMRIIGGVLAVCAGFGALGTIAAVAQAYLVQDAYKIEGQAWLYAGLMVLAGVLLALLFWLAAYMLFAGKATKRLFVAAAIIIAAGLLSFGTGVVPFVLGIRAEESKFRAEMSKSIVHKSIDAAPIKPAKRLELKSALPITVNYNVDPTRTEATLWYNTARTKYDPAVQLVTSPEGVLTVNLPIEGSQCLPDVTKCRTQTTVTIVGPALESIEAQGSNLVRYIVDTQDTLKVYTRADGRVELQSVGTINHLDATLSNESHLDTKQAGITTINLVIEDALSNADIATVSTLTVTAPKACADSHGGGTISVRRAQTVTVNGATFDPEKDYPCMTMQVDSSQ